MDEFNQDYYRFDFIGQIDEINLAKLYEFGFDSFEEKENSSEGYLSQRIFNEDLSEKIKSIHPYSSYTLIKQQNWNALWEASFLPILIDDRIHVRATFHPATNIHYEIIIDPKMAFGTGHHATTHLVLSEMLKVEFNNSRVLDFGCGSGILAIASEKLGAREVTAIDHDKWSVENTQENIALNHCKHIKVYQADRLDQEAELYDHILANITRDVLIHNTRDILRLLRVNGYVIYSGHR
jgi:ribosomal protein L11 methyltransferase